MVALCSPQPVSIVPNAKLTFADGPHLCERNVIHGRFHSPAYVQSLRITMQCARRGARRCTDPHRSLPRLTHSQRLLSSRTLHRVKYLFNS